eukprot:10056610-Alexandrium_andersonii.AAC.1
MKHADVLVQARICQLLPACNGCVVNVYAESNPASVCAQAPCTAPKSYCNAPGWCDPVSYTHLRAHETSAHL